MPSRLRNKSTSEIPGQSGHALPSTHRQLWANECILRCGKNGVDFHRRSTVKEVTDLPRVT
jgi:hypothetical protein